MTERDANTIDLFATPGTQRLQGHWPDASRSSSPSYAQTRTGTMKLRLNTG